MKAVAQDNGTTAADQRRPRVSVGLPVFNGERYLREALDSLLAQTYTDFELIICDNASTDGTERICRQYAARDTRIRYIRNENNIGAARNYRRSFELARGIYFRWATYDDLSGPEFLERGVDVLDDHPEVILAYPRTRLIDDQGRVTADFEDNLHLLFPSARQRFVEFFQRLRLCNPVYGLIRADVLRQTALLGAFIASDRALLAELTLYGKFWEVPEFLFYRRIHAAAYSSQKDLKQLRQFYNPKDRGKIALTECRLYQAYCGALGRSPLPLREKLQVGMHLARMIVWGRQKLAEEIWGAMRQVLHRA